MTQWAAVVGLPYRCSSVVRPRNDNTIGPPLVRTVTLGIEFEFRRSAAPRLTSLGRDRPAQPARGRWQMSRTRRTMTCETTEFRSPAAVFWVSAESRRNSRPPLSLRHVRDASKMAAVPYALQKPARAGRPTPWPWRDEPENPSKCAADWAGVPSPPNVHKPTDSAH